MEIEIKIIDFLIATGGCDTCLKCMFAKPINENDDVEPCKEFEKDGNIACRNGMIEYFKNNE